MTATKEPVWSGKNPIPEKGAIVGIPFGIHTVAGRMTGTFVMPGAEGDYLGVTLELLELPRNAEKYGWAGELETLCKEKRRYGLAEFWKNPDAFKSNIPGSEIGETPEEPVWLKEHGLGAEEEFAAIVPMILGKEDWREELSITAWCQGEWHNTPYPEFCGELQRIRNTARMEFVDYAIEKNKGLIEGCRRWMKITP